jgi:UDPglucose 6-dehydrogenase
MNLDKPKIGISGLGFVGSAMMNSFITKGYEVNINLFVYDKYKEEYNDINCILQTDIVFLALPTVYDEYVKSYNLDPLYNNLSFLEKSAYNGLIVIKSTVEPEACHHLSSLYKILDIVHNPEFLTARTSYKDFHNQIHIVLGKTSMCSESKFQLLKNFYKTNYKDAEISICNACESESMKLFLNSFYAMKVQFFTEMYILCDKMGIEYDKVKDMMLKNKWINPMHTNVPGSDNKISYGGMCFPKDTNALLQVMIKHDSPHAILESTIKERDDMRDD